MSEQEKQKEVKDNALTHEQIISESQRGVDRSLTILNYTISMIGILVGVLTLTIVIIGGVAAFLGIRGYKDFKNLKQSFAESQEQVKVQAENVNTLANEVGNKYNAISTNIGELESTVENKISSIEEKFLFFINEKKEELHELYEKHKDELSRLSITEEPSEETKEKLDELAKKSEFLEGVGVVPGPEDYFNRGLDYALKDKYEEAKDAFGKATELNLIM